MRIDFKWYNEVHHKAELRTRRGGEEKRGLQDSITSESSRLDRKKKKSKNHEVNSNSTAE